jgi:hypothetical protein
MRNIFSETFILLIIVSLSVLVFLLIISHPEARDITSSNVLKDSINGQHSFTLQSKENLKFANSASLIEGIKQYYKAWPPAFPIMLFFFKKIKIPPLLFNLMIYLLNMTWFYFILKKNNLETSVRFLILFSYTIGVFHYHNLVIQVVSEGLFILISQLIFTLLLHYSKDSKYQTIGCLAILTSFSILTKYFGLFWIFPIVSICIFIFSKNILMGVKHFAVYGIVSILLTIPWFIWNYKTTGYLTGWDRSSARLISDLTDFDHNLFFSIKTYYIDFFSRDWASHSVIRMKYDFQIWDLFVLLLLSVIAISIFKGIRDRIKGRGIIKIKRISDFIKGEKILFLLIMFSVSYLLVILTLWTLSNNDPIYTRFLYPSYPFLILTIVTIYDRFAKNKPHLFFSTIFNALFVTILASQSYKIVILLNRYIMF